jgi:hypothetical protein
VSLRRKHYVVASTIAVLCLAVGLFLFLDFRGCLDRGTFEVIQAAEGPGGRIATIARRYDHDSLGGNEYWVFVSDHIYSPKELRMAYYHSDKVFSADRDGFDVHWIGPNALEIDCNNCEITKDDMNEQRTSSGNVSVRYFGFP